MSYRHGFPRLRFAAVGLAFYACLLPVESLSATVTLEENQPYHTDETGYSLGGANITFRTKGQTVVGVAATGFWVVCFRGTYESNAIRIAQAVNQDSERSGQSIVYAPLWDSLKDRFVTLGIAQPVEPFPNPRAIIKTPNWVVERNLHWLRSCEAHFGELAVLAAPASEEGCDENAFPGELLNDPKDRVQANREWVVILQTLRDFYDAQRTRLVADRAETRAHAAIAHQFLNLANLAISNRSSDGGWSGELARESLFALSQHLLSHKDEWMKGSGELKGSVYAYCAVADDILGFASAESICALLDVGQAHFDSHLRPFFDQYWRRKLALAIPGCKERRTQRLFTVYQAVRGEHRDFVYGAVVPGFEEVSEMTREEREDAMINVPGKAGNLRQDAAEHALRDLVQSGSIEEAELDELLFQIRTLELQAPELPSLE